MIKMYAIPNCDTVKKARNWLEKNGINYEFSDFKKVAPEIGKIKTWAEFFGELPVNKKGLTYKKYKETYEALTGTEKLNFLRENSSMLKRPILENDGVVVAIGFDEDIYGKLKI